MVTVTDPSGSPTIIYTKDGVTIDSLTTSGTNQGSAAAVIRYCGHTVILVDSPTNSPRAGIILPSDAEIGDVVQLTNTNDTWFTYNLYPDSGSKIDIHDTDAPQAVNISRVLRKVGASLWVTISGEP